jgi:hypothetical protein
VHWVDRKGVEHDESEFFARAEARGAQRAFVEALPAKECCLECCYSTHSRQVSRTGFKSNDLSRAHTYGSTSDSPPTPTALIYILIYLF